MDSNEIKERFAKMSDDEFIQSFNEQVGNSGTTHTRMIYLASFQEELDRRVFDYSGIISEQDGHTAISFAKEIYLDEGRVIKVEN